MIQTLQPQIILSGLIGVICFFPYMFHWGFEGVEFTDHSAITDPIVSSGNVALMSISGYMISEAALDSYMLPSPPHVSIPRWMMMLGIFGSCVLFATQNDDNPERKLVLMVSCNYCRMCFLIIPMMFDNSKLRHIITIALIVCSGILFVLYPFNKLGPLQALAPYLIILIFGVALCICGNGIYSRFKNLTATNTTGFEKYQPFSTLSSVCM
jgi:hypothetical protein